MIMIRKARPRRQPNRVTLVELDGTPVRQSAADWPAWTDNWFWDTTPDADLDDHFAAEAPDDIDGDGEAGWVQAMVEASLPPARFEPTAEDLAWLAALKAQEAAEKARVVAAYRPLPDDLAEYAAWSEALDSGMLPASAAGRFAFGEYDAIRSGQVTETELAMQAAGMAL